MNIKRAELDVRPERYFQPYTWYSLFVPVQQYVVQDTFDEKFRLTISQVKDTIAVAKTSDS